VSSVSSVRSRAATLTGQVDEPSVESGGGSNFTILSSPSANLRFNHASSTPTADRKRTRQQKSRSPYGMTTAHTSRISGRPPRPPSKGAPSNFPPPKSTSVAEKDTSLSVVRQTSSCSLFSGTRNDKVAKKNIRGHAVSSADVYSMQDVGNYQVLFDECAFLCSGITNISLRHLSKIDMLKKLRNAVGSAVELAHLLSSKSKRRTLFLQTQSLPSLSSYWDNEALQLILSVFGWISSFVTETILLDSVDRDSLCDAIPRSSQRSNLTTASPLKSDHETSTLFWEWKQQLLDVLGICIYFVSLDCTLSDESCSVSSSGGNGSRTTSLAAKAARRIRHLFLTHDSCIRGILHLILEDPLTLVLRGSTCSDTTYERNVLSHVEFVLPGVSPSSPFGISKTGQCAVNVDTPISNRFSLGASKETPESGQTASSSRGSVDPTAAGRLKRKKQRLEKLEREQRVSDLEGQLWHEVAMVDRLSFPSDSSPSQNSAQHRYEENLTCANNDDLLSLGSSTRSFRKRKTKDILDPLIKQVYDSLRLALIDGSDKNSEHVVEPHRYDVLTDESTCLIRTYVPLVSLANVISGKRLANEDSCIDDDDGQDNNESISMEYNPLLETNCLLGQNGAIPLLSQALSKTLAAVTYQVDIARTSVQHDQATVDFKTCIGCVAALQFRVQKLVSLIDGASLLCPLNREQFCKEGFTGELGGFLVVGLLNVLQKLLWKDASNATAPPILFDGVWDEVALAVLKMLTSLSHENKTAAQELEAMLCLGVSDSEMNSSTVKESCGLQVIADVLHHAISRPHDASDAKLLYDAVVFCLNILANSVESGCSRNVFVNMVISTHSTNSSGRCSVRFLVWLTRWLVDETQSFRDAVIESTFGSSPCKHQERHLDEKEDEKLVLAGNGFIFLCCLLVDDRDGTDASAENDPTTIVLNELPGSSREAKLRYMKNTLKAFCNFYHYSVGDLSIAIVDPVKRLIQRLDSILLTNHMDDNDS
jgi:hypothetical protein